MTQHDATNVTNVCPGPARPKVLQVDLCLGYLFLDQLEGSLYKSRADVFMIVPKF